MALRRFSVTPTVSNAVAYVANDVIGGRLQAYGIGAPPGIRLHSIVIADRDAQNVDYVLTIMDAAPTDILDNAAITTLADADVSKIIYEKIIDAATYRRSYTANSKHEVTGLDVPLMSNEADGDLWFFLWTTGGPTYTSTAAIALTLWFSPFK